MKKIFIIVGAAVIVLVGIFFSLIARQIGPGTSFEVKVVKGCDVLRMAADDIILLSEGDRLDQIIVRYGFPANGLKRSSLREYCSSRGFEGDVETCLSFKDNAVFSTQLFAYCNIQRDWFREMETSP